MDVKEEKSSSLNETLQNVFSSNCCATRWRWLAEGALPLTSRYFLRYLVLAHAGVQNWGLHTNCLLRIPKDLGCQSASRNCLQCVGYDTPNTQAYCHPLVAYTVTIQKPRDIKTVIAFAAYCSSRLCFDRVTYCNGSTLQSTMLYYRLIKN